MCASFASRACSDLLIAKIITTERHRNCYGRCSGFQILWYRNALKLNARLLLIHFSFRYGKDDIIADYAGMCFVTNIAANELF